jgi:osmoprotectant transport system permease protein
VNALLEGLRWIADPAHWSGPNGIPVRVEQQVLLSVVALAVASLIAVPVGLRVGHTHRWERLSLAVSNVGRAIPTFAVLSLSFLVIVNVWPKYAFGFWPTVVALVLLGIPPILVNTILGVRGVDADTVEAARGMGMTGKEVLMGLEIPLAMPLIVTGTRIAALQIVSTATLSALIGGGTLGRYIVDGAAQQDAAQLVAGAILVATLALVTEALFSILARASAPRLTSRAVRISGAITPAQVGPA